MASFLQVCLALLLVSCVHGQGPSYLSGLLGQCSGGTYTSQVTNCSLNLLTTLSLGSSADIATIYNAICNNIPAVVTFNGCLRTTLEGCLSTDFQRLLQTDAGVRDSSQYYCDHKNEFNQECIVTALLSGSCTRDVATAYATAINQTGLVPATCSFLETTRGCIYNLGTSCPNHNRDVYNTYYQKNYPPACAGGARSVPTSFLLLGACAVLLNKMAAAFFF